MRHQASLGCPSCWDPPKVRMKVHGIYRNLIFTFAWWRHQMETLSALLALCAGKSPVTDEFPSQRPVTRSFNIFFALRLKTRLSKPWGYWFETPQRSLWRHCNGTSKERHDAIINEDVMTWKLFSHYWPVVRGIRRWPEIKSFGALFVVGLNIEHTATHTVN